MISLSGHLLSNLLSVLEESTPVLFAGIVLATAISILYSTWSIMYAFRAKVRAHFLLQNEARIDAKLQAVLRDISNSTSDIDPEQLAAFRRQIEMRLNKLPPPDFKIIKEGLNQPSQVGAERFLKDVASAA
jgi:hypothetical protein